MEPLLHALAQSSRAREAVNWEPTSVFWPPCSSVEICHQIRRHRKAFLSLTFSELSENGPGNFALDSAMGRGWSRLGRKAGSIRRGRRIGWGWLGSTGCASFLRMTFHTLLTWTQVTENRVDWGKQMTNTEVTVMCELGFWELNAKCVLLCLMLR